MLPAPAGAQVQPPAQGAVPPVQGHEHRAHGVAPVVPLRAGQARDGHRQVAAAEAAAPRRHGQGHWLRHRPALRQQVLRHPQGGGLHLVGVADHPAPEDLGGPGQVGDALGDEAAGAALGGGEGQAPLPQEAGDHLLQTPHVHAVDHVPQGLPHLLHQGAEHLLRRRPVRGLGGGPDHALVFLGVGGQGGVGEGGHGLPEPGLHMALPHAEDPDLVADDDPVGEGGQVGHGPVLEHVPALPGRARQHENVDPVLAEGAARGGAHRVVEDGAAHRQHGLLAVVLRHGPARPGEVGPNGLQDVRVELELSAEGLADGLLGQVVVGGAQAPGGDDDVRPAAGDVQGVRQALGVVPHHRVVVDGDPQGAEALGDDLGVQVGDVAQQELGADGDQLRGVVHRGASFSLPPLAAGFFFDPSMPAHPADAGLKRVSPGGWGRTISSPE